MKTVVLNEPHHFALTRTRVPKKVAPDEALVRVHRVGVCGTDLHAFQGNQPFFSYPRILGHELGVEVVALGGPAAGLEVGDRCAVIPYLYDGTCTACRRGKTNCCVNMKVLGVHVDGGMREFITVPTCLLVKANDLPFEHLAQVEMLAIGAHALTWAQLQSDENILVIGAGPIGLGVMAFAKAQAARVLAMDRSEARLAFVEAHGLAETMSAKGDTVTLLKERFGGELPTTVFDATGSAHSMMDTPDYTAHGGRIVFVGHTRGELTFANPTLHSRELTLHCSRNATEKDFETVIASLRRKAFDLNLWLTHRASLESFIGDFPKWLEPESGVVKAVLEF